LLTSDDEPISSGHDQFPIGQETTSLAITTGKAKVLPRSRAGPTGASARKSAMPTRNIGRAEERHGQVVIAAVVAEAVRARVRGG